MEWNGDTEYLSFQEAMERGIVAPCSVLPKMWDIPDKDMDPAEGAADMMFAIDTCNSCPVRVACRGLPRKAKYTGIIGGEIRWHEDEDLLHIRRLTRALAPLLVRRSHRDGAA
jgi:hypothetical protein